MSQTDFLPSAQEDAWRTSLLAEHSSRTWQMRMFGEPDIGFSAIALAAHLEPAAELQAVGPTQTSGDMTCAQGPAVAACLVTNDKGSVEIRR